MTDAGRTAEIAASLAEVRQRIRKACADAGRAAGDVTLVAVTKFFPAADAIALVELGVTDLGESRDPEGADKAREVGAAGGQPTWHFVGQLQSNKARSVARYVDLVHSVDRASLVDALARAASQTGRPPLGVLLQVNLDLPGSVGQDGPRGGVSPAGVAELADAVTAADSLRLRGVMAVAPRDGDPAEAFATLATVSSDLRRRHPGADVVSAGMSGDLEAAIAHGATHVRIGTALLGRRSAAVR